LIPVAPNDREAVTPDLEDAGSPHLTERRPLAAERASRRVEDEAKLLREDMGPEDTDLPVRPAIADDGPLGVDRLDVDVPPAA
jgi:hypothetical protein